MSEFKPWTTVYNEHGEAGSYVAAVEDFHVVRVDVTDEDGIDDTTPVIWYHVQAEHPENAASDAVARYRVEIEELAAEKGKLDREVGLAQVALARLEPFRLALMFEQGTVTHLVVYGDGGKPERIEPWAVDGQQRRESVKVVLSRQSAFYGPGLSWECRCYVGSERVVPCGSEAEARGVIEAGQVVSEG